MSRLVLLSLSLFSAPAFAQDFAGGATVAADDLESTFDAHSVSIVAPDGQTYEADDVVVARDGDEFIIVITLVEGVQSEDLVSAWSDVPIYMDVEAAFCR